MRTLVARAACGRRSLTAFVVLILVALASIVAAATAVAGESPAPVVSADRLTLRLGTTFDADNLNPFLGFSGTSYEVFHLNYDFLVGYNTDLSPRPELATSWTTSSDGKTWTFKLRRGVRWHDGKPFTAKDVVFTYRYIIDNNLTAFTSYTNSIETVKAVDDFTVTMTCSRPKANMLRLWIPILPAHVWSKVPGTKAGVDYQVELPLVGTGPFQTVAAEKGSYLKLVKNPDYWVEGKPTIDEVIISIYQNPDTMAQDLKSGELDYAQGMAAAQFDALKNEAALTTNAAGLRYFDELCMNCYDDPHSLGSPVLRDRDFRRAISWAVDKQKVVDIAYGGYATVGQGLITPDVPTYAWSPSPAQTFGFDLAKARELLDQAGYRDRDGDGVREANGKPIALRLWSRSDDVASQNCGRLVAGWFRDVGLKISLQTLDTNAIYSALYNKDKAGNYAPDYDLYLWGGGQYVDPDYILNVFTKSQIGGSNDPCWANAEYDSLYVRQSQTVDPAQRKPLVDRMASIFYDEAPFVITNYEQQLEAYNTLRWDGWTQAPAGGPVAFINANIDTYLNLTPVAGQESSGVVGTWVYALVALGGAVLAVVVVLLLRRGRSRAVEE